MEQNDVKKQYSSEVFQDDESSLGYQIDVYQESINKTFSEYLVNFEFLEKELEHYGFVKVNKFEAKKMGFRKAVGSFKDLFDMMEEDIHLRKIHKRCRCSIRYDIERKTNILSQLLYI